MTSNCWIKAYVVIALLTLAAVPLGLCLQAPQAQSSATDLYRLAPGDSFEVNFRLTPEFNQTVTIQPDGHATVNAAGDIKAAGLTLPELHGQIATLAKARLLDPEFTVILKDFERARIAVAGEVATPGRYELRSPTTALQAILLAGGQKETASMAHVILFRRVGDGVMEVHRLNFGGIDRGKPVKTDLLLQPGDMILVPRDNIAKFGRYVRTLNLGVYFSPTGNIIP